MGRLDDALNVPIVELSLLRGLPIFWHLPAPALEGLARNATPVSFPAGTLLMSEGKRGDRYLAIAARAMADDVDDHSGLPEP